MGAGMGEGLRVWNPNLSHTQDLDQGPVIRFFFFRNCWRRAAMA